MAVLCAYGIQEDDSKVLLHLALGDKESAACWQAFFEDMRRRGLDEPFWVVMDGNTGLRKAVERKRPNALIRRCQVHKMRNILCKLPDEARPQIKKLIRQAFTAARYEEGLAQARSIIAQYKETYESAMKCPEQDPW